MESSTGGGCEIGRLPEELLASIIISLAPSPRDVCRAAAVSRAFRAAADSDAVWSRLLPRDLPRFAKKEIPRAPTCKKGLFRRLSDQPPSSRASSWCMRLDRVTAAKCYTFSVRALRISWGNTSCYRRWIPLRF